MSKKFCGQCGTELNPNARFCPNCGKPSEMAEIDSLEKNLDNTQNLSKPKQEENKQNHQQVQCTEIEAADIEKQTEMKTEENVSGMAAPVSAVEPGKISQVTLKGQRNAANHPPEQESSENTHTAGTGGIMVFTQKPKAVASQVAPAAGIGPVKYFFSGFGRMLKGFPTVFKDKKRFVFAGVLTVIWLVLTLLPALGVNAPAVRRLSLLTFARGGLNGGVLGLVGGVIGKGVFAFFLSSLLMPLFGGGKPMSGLGHGFKTFFGSFAVKDLHALSFLLLGAGLALAVYNFLTGNASIQNGMVGIAAFFVSVRALSLKAGFLRGFMLSMSKKARGGKATQPVFVNRVIAGWAVGFLLGVALSNTGVSIIGYIAGLVLVVAAVVLKIVAGNKKAVTE